MPVKSYSQDEQLKLADNYFSAGQYYNAITEYKRFLFFNPHNRLVTEINYKIGLSYKFDRKWDEAIATFKALTNSNDDSLSYKARLQIGIVYLASGQQNMAEYELLRISTFCKYNTIKLNSYFFLGLCYLYKSDWLDAKEYLDKFYSINCNLNIERIDSLLKLSCNYHYRSPKTAKWLSTFVPGSGQLYAGDVKNSINALLINSLTVYLAVNSILGRQLWDFLLIDITIFERFYTGNRVKSEDYVNDKNVKINESFRKKIIEEINTVNNSVEGIKCVGINEI